MEVARGVHRLEGIRGANSYLYLSDDGRVVVIDTGMAGNAGRIASQVEALGRKRGEIEMIVLTHPDVDHAGSVAELKRITGARVAIHEADAPGLARERQYKRAKGFSGFLFGLMMRFFKFEPLLPDIVLKDGDAVADLRVVHCPGHTPGSICLYKQGEAIFVGDALRTDRQGNPKLSPGAMSSDPQQAAESVRKMAGLEFEALLPGHGEPICGNAGERVRSWLESAG